MYFYTFIDITIAFANMTPDKRLNQLEPIVADVVQKVDRLIEGNGQIINEVSKIPGIEKNVNIIATGLAELTINVNQQFSQVNQRFGQLDQRFDQQQQQIDGLRGEMQVGFQKIDQRFDQLVPLIQDRLK